jgi:hypothetical protein
MSQGQIPSPLAVKPRADDEASLTAPTVFGVFTNSEALNAAIKELEIAGFDRADLGLPEFEPEAIPDLTPKPPDTDVEAQQSRIFHTSVGGAFAAVLAAMIAAMLGGGIGAMVGAAIGAALVVGALAQLVSRMASRREQADRDRKAVKGELVLSVRTAAPEKVSRATGILLKAGAVKTW